MGNDLVPTGRGFFASKVGKIDTGDGWGNIPTRDDITKRRLSLPPPEGGKTIALVPGSDGMDLAMRVDAFLRIQPRPPEMRILMLCSTARRPFLIPTQLKGRVLYFLNSEIDTQAHMRDGTTFEEMASFETNIDAWSGCPFCSSTRSYWWSNHCTGGCRGKLHCYGSMDAGTRTCVCGVVHGRPTSSKSSPITGFLPGYSTR